jgi:ubiquinone/menaquinone biosynthesis C-methylase UbiE
MDGRSQASIHEAWKATRGSFLAPLLAEPLLRTAFDYLQRRLPPHALVLDVGCGHGHATHAFTRCGYRAIGLDVHEATLREGRGLYPGNRLAAGSADRLPLRDRSVDALFCFSVLQYVDREMALAECSRVLRPGAHFVFVENLAGNPVAKAYRAWRKWKRIRFPDQVEPLQHLRWVERSVYRRYFSDVSFEAHYLMTPLALHSTAAQTGTGQEPATRRIRRLFAAAHGAERLLTALVPPARALCWNAVIYGAK